MRAPEQVKEDVLEGYLSRRAAETIYGVMFDGELQDETLTVSSTATEKMRASLSDARS